MAWKNRMINIFESKPFAKVHFINEHVQFMFPREDALSLGQKYKNLTEAPEFSEIQELWVLIIENIHPYLLASRETLLPFYETVGTFDMMDFENFLADYFFKFGKAKELFFNEHNFDAESEKSFYLGFLEFSSVSGSMIYLLQNHKGFIGMYKDAALENAKLQKMITIHTKSILPTLSEFGLSHLSLLANTAKK